ncbi:EEF1A lysine methyltransferase 1 [Trichonephila clavipes]|nr:EEF1A lysine methyltransferase 1 [Trichonephila clavipes]
MEKDLNDGNLSFVQTRLERLMLAKTAIQAHISNAFVEEDWELSQFWYDEETSLTLAKAAVECVGEKGRIACVSSPSVYNQLQKLSNSKEHYLFEFDKRFQDKFPGQTIFYDYKTPLELDLKFQMYFDVVIADPPFLSQECLEKFTQTINFLTEKKILLCTGSVNGTEKLHLVVAEDLLDSINIERGFLRLLAVSKNE